MNTSAAHLQLHTCISLSSNCQEFVTVSSRLTYCSPLPLDAMNFVNITIQKKVCRALGEHSAVNSCAACIWQRLQTAQHCTVYTAEFPFTQSGRHCGRNGTFSKPKFRSACCVRCYHITGLSFLPVRPSNVSTSLWFRV